MDLKKFEQLKQQYDSALLKEAAYKERLSSLKDKIDKVKESLSAKGIDVSGTNEELIKRLEDIMEADYKRVSESLEKFNSVVAEIDKHE